MVVIYVRDDGLIDFSHYTSDKVVSPRIGRTYGEKNKLLIVILLFNFCIFSCSKSPIRHPIIKANNNVTRFSMTDGKTGKRYSGIFDEDKNVLLYGEGIIPPFIGGFSYLQKNYSANIAIDCTGKTYTEFELPEVYESFYGYGIYSTYDNKNDYSYVIDKNGNIINRNGIVTMFGDFAIINKNGKMTYFNIIKNSYLPNNNYYDDCYNFFNGYAKVAMKDEQSTTYGLSKSYGLIDTEGNLLIPCEYSYLEYRKQGYATASKTCKDPVWEKKAEFGLLDLNNNWILEQKYNYIVPITDSVVALWMIEYNSDYWVLHNIKTKESLKLNINYSLVNNINIFSTNSEFDYLVYFDTSNEKYGFINSKGKIILNALCEKIEPFPDNGYWQVLINDKWMLFKEGEGILDPEEYLDFKSVK